MLGRFNFNCINYNLRHEIEFMDESQTDKLLEKQPSLKCEARNPDQPQIKIIICIWHREISQQALIQQSEIQTQPYTYSPCVLLGAINNLQKP